MDFYQLKGAHVQSIPFFSAPCISLSAFLQFCVFFTTTGSFRSTSSSLPNLFYFPYQFYLPVLFYPYQVTETV